MPDRKFSSHAAGAAPGLAPNRSIEYVLEQAEDPDKFCTALAKLFAVRPTEVAMLKLEKALLYFIYPKELKTAGAIPISSSSAIAAHTATSKKTEVFNSFSKVKHASIFETVKLANREEAEQIEVQNEQPSIQKLMSAAILTPESKVLGVIQISRKGFSPSSAGPDFSESDVMQLKLATVIAAKMDFMTKRS